MANRPSAAFQSLALAVFIGVVGFVVYRTYVNAQESRRDTPQEAPVVSAFDSKFADPAILVKTTVDSSAKPELANLLAPASKPEFAFPSTPTSKPAFFSSSKSADPGGAVFFGGSKSADPARVITHTRPAPRGAMTASAPASRPVRSAIH